MILLLMIIRDTHITHTYFLEHLFAFLFCHGQNTTINYAHQALGYYYLVQSTQTPLDYTHLTIYSTVDHISL